MITNNGFSQLAKLMFTNAADEDRLKELLTENYAEADLTGYLQSRDPLLGRAAGAALRLIGTNSVIPDLLDALKYRDPGTRFNAEHALWGIWARSGNPRLDTLLQTGKSLLKNGDYIEAVEHFTRIIESDPEFAEAYNQRAIAYFMREEWTEAIRDCKRTLARNPNHFGALAGMGHVYARLGKTEEAMQAYRQALRINPNLSTIAEAFLRLRKRSGSD